MKSNRGSSVLDILLWMIGTIGAQDNPGLTARSLEANTAGNFITIVRVGN